MNLRYYGTIPESATMLSDARNRAAYLLSKYVAPIPYIPKVSRQFDSMLEGKAKVEPINCPKCNSPLNAGQCDLCISVDSIAASITQEPIQATPPAWNWEQFFSLVANNEIELSANSPDDTLQARIESLQELDRQTELLRQSIRIRIQVNGTELESRGKKIKAKKSLSDMAYTPALPKVSTKLTKLEQVKANMNEMGIDFDSFMLSIKRK